MPDKGSFRKERRVLVAILGADTFHNGRVNMTAECEADGHIASAIKKHWATMPLALMILSHLELQSMELCCSHSGRVFLYHLGLSGSILTGTPASSQVPPYPHRYPCLLRAPPHPQVTPASSQQLMITGTPASSQGPLCHHRYPHILTGTSTSSRHPCILTGTPASSGHSHILIGTPISSKLPLPPHRHPHILTVTPIWSQGPHILTGTPASSRHPHILKAPPYHHRHPTSSRHPYLLKAPPHHQCTPTSSQVPHTLTGTPHPHRHPLFPRWL